MVDFMSPSPALEIHDYTCLLCGFAVDFLPRDRLKARFGLCYLQPLTSNGSDRMTIKAMAKFCSVPTPGMFPHGPENGALLGVICKKHLNSLQLNQLFSRQRLYRSASHFLRVQKSTSLVPNRCQA
jgi:hypothetical protein